ncbi:MAG: PilZ domain-containing protein [Dehalococcoidia bacterium]
MTTTLFRQGERRRTPRYAAWQPLTLTVAGSGDSLPATLLDISATGALFRLEPGAQPPRSVELHIRLGAEQQRLMATVLTTEPTWNGSLVHVRFDSVKPDERSHLGDLLADRQASTETRRPGPTARILPFERAH